MEVAYAISDFADPAFASASFAVGFFLWIRSAPVLVRIALAGLLGAILSRGPVVYSRISDFGNEAELMFAGVHFAVYLPLSLLAAWMFTWMLQRKFSEQASVFE